MGKTIFLAGLLVLGFGASDAQAAELGIDGDPCAHPATDAQHFGCRTRVTAEQMRLIEQRTNKLIENAVGEPDLKEAHQKSHRAWLRHRDAECLIDTWESRRGSVGAVYVLACEQRRNAARLADLEARLSAP